MDMFLKTFSLQMVMFCYLFCGMLAYKLNIITDEGRSSLIALTGDILLPVLIFRSFLSISREALASSFIILILSALVCVYSFIIGKFAYPKAKGKKLDVLRYDTLVANSSFAGIPLVEGLYGSIGTVYSSMFTVSSRLAMWSVGLAIFTGKQADLKATLLRLIKHPCIIATILGIVFWALSIPLPQFITKSLAGVSACVAPVSMIVVGSVMATVSLSELFDLYTCRYCAIRLFVIPLIAFFLCRLLALDSVQTGSMLILSAMPAPSTSAILAGRHGGDLHYASKLLFVSNILSIITVPLMMLLL